MPQYFEAAMIICFGLSWPLSVLKSWRSRTTKGKSLFFEVFILLGYLCGITGKLMTGNVTYVLIFYIINALMVSVDLCLYARNRRLDRLAAETHSQGAAQTE
jgi:formate hydrogenlyase subunit 3/multisubunit Na+/H+ antiporter MnhD subunit